MEEHVSLKTARKLSTGFEKPLKGVNIPKGWYSKHLFSLLWFISKLPFSLLWLNFLLLAVLKVGRVSLSQHLRWMDRQRERWTPRATSLTLTSSRSQPLCGLLSWDPATQNSEPWSESAASAQPPPHSASPNAGGPEHPWSWSSSRSYGASHVHNRSGKLYNASSITWLERSERMVAKHGWLLLTRWAYVAELLSIMI